MLYIPCMCSISPAQTIEVPTRRRTLGESHAASLLQLELNQPEVSPDPTRLRLALRYVHWGDLGGLVQT